MHATLLLQYSTFQAKHQLIEKQQEIDSKNMLLEFFTEFIDRHMLEDRYDKLYNAIRNSYNLNVLPGFKIRGGAVWKAEGSEGIRYVAVSVGKDRFFPFNANDSKSDGEERIMVVDCYLESTVKFHFAGRAAFASDYILCYPLVQNLLSLCIFEVIKRFRIKRLLF